MASQRSKQDQEDEDERQVERYLAFLEREAEEADAWEDQKVKWRIPGDDGTGR